MYMLLKNRNNGSQVSDATLMVETYCAQENVTSQECLEGLKNFQPLCTEMQQTEIKIITAYIILLYHCLKLVKK